MCSTDVIVLQVQNMKCKSVIAVVVLAATVIAAEELSSVQAQDHDQNAANITSDSTYVEEGRIRHHHLFGHNELFPFYGGLCKYLLLK